MYQSKCAIFVFLALNAAALGQLQCNNKTEHPVRCLCPRQPTCERPEPPDACELAACKEGCACQEGFVRVDAAGPCVRLDECPKPKLTVECGDNEEVDRCASPCQPTCTDPNPRGCPTLICSEGCVCKKGYVRLFSGGPCVEKAACFYKCPENNTVYQSCGTACPPTCKTMDEDIVCPKVCVRGCFCKEGYVRQCPDGPCVPKEACFGQCEAENTEFRECGSACPPTCKTWKEPVICPAVCVKGCFCKEPYVIEDVSGKCVLKEDCPNY